MSNDGRFQSTQWSVVLAAGQSSPDSMRALESLCGTYWYPLYAFARRRGRPREDAEDLTQAFVARVLEKDFLRSADPGQGRFRSFLLTMFKRFIATETSRQNAQKRGGGVQKLSLDFERGEARYLNEPADQWTPEKLYDRRWALTLLARVMDSLRDHYEEQGKLELFEHCQVYLTGTVGAPPYAETAKVVGISEGAFRVAVHRVRERYRDLLSAEVAQTLETTDDIESELEYLRTAIRGE